MDHIWICGNSNKLSSSFECIKDKYSITYFNQAQSLSYQLDRATPALCIIDIEFLDDKSIELIKTYDLNTVLLITEYGKHIKEKCFEIAPLFFLLQEHIEEMLEISLYNALANLKKAKLKSELVNKWKNIFTPKEREIFSLFISNKNKVFTRDAISKELWPNTKVVSKTLEVHISNIRKKSIAIGYNIVNLGTKGFKLEEIKDKKTFQRVL